MDLLRTPTPPRSRAATVLLLAGACAVLGCSLFERLAPSARGPRFSHRLHVEEEGLACEVCHETAWVEDAPGMPVPDACSVCHEVIDEEKPDGRRVAALFVGEVFVAARVSALDEELRFSHLRHVSAELDCAACHRGIEGSTAVDDELALSMADCVDCHAERGVGQACAVCHSSVGVDVAPATHHDDWKRVHGSVARSACTRTVDDCSLCHLESACNACHLDEPPLDHNGFFRRRGHGLRAQLDRERCATCHRPDSCERCHSEALPMSHGGLWGGTFSAHCHGCHVPLSAQGCATCHKAAPSHAQAPPKPPWHDPAMNCRQCHGLTIPLPHADNGSNCNLCHG